MKNIHIGLFGAGTVGGGVLEILKKKEKYFAKKGIKFVIDKICVKNPEKSRDFFISDHTKIVTEPHDILGDENIDLVIELIGGTTLAKDIVFTAIDLGKHVITANKALVEAYLPEIREKLNKYPDVFFGFEAAVAGGIPVIQTLQSHVNVDEVQKVLGILNGTTNFMLSKMSQEGADYSDVLKEAQDLGFAESDPSADVEGYDARAKLSILSNLSWGIDLVPDNIKTQGITQVTKHDFEYAQYLKSNIKLLAVAEKKSGKISAYISPVVVPNDNPISQINGVTNVVEITSEFLGKSLLVGQGAGRFPTANSVVSDLLKAVTSTPFHFEKNNSIKTSDDAIGTFYIRIFIKDCVGIVRKVGEACEKNNVSIDSILQLPIEDKSRLPFVITTDETKRSLVEQVAKDLAGEDFCVEAPLVLPILVG